MMNWLFIPTGNFSNSKLIFDLLAACPAFLPPFVSNMTPQVGTPGLTPPSKFHGYHPVSVEQFNDSAEKAQILVQSRGGSLVGSTGIPGSAIVVGARGDAVARPTRAVMKMMDFMISARFRTVGSKDR
jgi:hypothetical protein